MIIAYEHAYAAQYILAASTCDHQCSSSCDHTIFCDQPYVHLLGRLSVRTSNMAGLKATLILLAMVVTFGEFPVSVPACYMLCCGDQGSFVVLGPKQQS